MLFPTQLGNTFSGVLNTGFGHIAPRVQLAHTLPHLHRNSASARLFFFIPPEGLRPRSMLRWNMPFHDHGIVQNPTYADSILR